MELLATHLTEIKFISQVKILMNGWNSFYQIIFIEVLRLRFTVE
jgi:hypothetical protein